MTLLELIGKLVMDSSEFNQAVNKAIDDGESLSKQLNNEFDKVEAGARDMGDTLKKQTDGNTFASAFGDGLVSATGEIIEEIFESAIEFGKQSIEAALAADRELEASYSDTMGRFDRNLQSMQETIGSALVPAMQLLAELFNAAFDVGGIEHFNIALGELESYSAGNLESLRTQLDGLFGLFDTVDAVEAGNIGDMTGALQSQAEYWADYADTLENLRARDIDTEFLNEIADGTTQSLERLKALESADTAQLDALVAAYLEVEAAKENTASSLNASQLSIDEDFQSMTDDLETFVSGLDQSERAYANVSNTMLGLTSAISEKYPTLAALVNQTNTKLLELGSVEISPPETGSFWGFLTPGWQQHKTADGSHASGLNYVPYDDYRAMLHTGEAVLTRQQAEEWRSGESRGGASAEDIAQAVKSALNGMPVVLGDQIVGRITDQVSNNIARKVKTATRRYATT